jgi:hypothetical protein
MSKKNEISFGRDVTLHFGSDTCGREWGTPRQPKVNWAAFGPVALWRAERFARAILRATTRGRDMRGKAKALAKVVRTVHKVHSNLEQTQCGLPWPTSRPLITSSLDWRDVTCRRCLNSETIRTEDGKEKGRH